MVGGIYSLREVGVLPCLYTFDPATPGTFSMIEYKNGVLDQPAAIPRAYSPSDYKEGELAALAFAEPGWCVVRRNLFERLGPNPFDRIRTRVLTAVVRARVGAAKNAAGESRLPRRPRAR
jgi:hypothetical protein